MTEIKGSSENTRYTRPQVTPTFDGESLGQLIEVFVLTERPSTTTQNEPWWHSAVIYQIYPRSFASTNDSGIGNLEGITSKFPYLVDLGVDAIWLSPFYESPMADFGYDISNHCDVDPIFGSLEDADALIAAAHEAGLKVVLDYVPNHVSDQHPWFVEARSSRDSHHRDWFVWRDPAPDGGPPNNWAPAFGGDSAWTLDETTGQYYLRLFLEQQPDLDWNHPDVVSEMHNVLRFWAERGVDGFRADVVHCIGKPEVLEPMPEDLVGLPAMLMDFGPGTHRELKKLRQLVDSFERETLLLGETVVLDRATMASYLGQGDELHLAFNFSALYSEWSPQRWKEEILGAYEVLDPIGGWPTWVLSNHDVQRHRTRFGSEPAARAAIVLLLTLRGTPFLYMGEELGLEDCELTEDQVLDPGGRDGCRAPIPWNADPGHGWQGTTWLPFPPQANGEDVASQQQDPNSMFAHYKELLRLRKATPVLQSGDFTMLDAPEGVIRWVRTAQQGQSGPERVEIAVNFTDQEIADAVSPGTLLGGTHIDDTSSTTLRPHEARIVALDSN